MSRKSKKEWKNRWWWIVAIATLTSMISASAITIWRTSYVVCFLLFTCIYFFLFFKILWLFYNLFAVKEKWWYDDPPTYVVSWWKRLILAVIAIWLVYLFVRLCKNWFVENICENVAVRCANHISLPWWWTPIQINWDNLLN